MPTTSSSTPSIELRDRLTLREYGLILVQLAALLALVWQFRLEEQRHLLAALCLATGGFAIHAWLPLRHRLAAFVAISIGAMILVLGPAQGGLSLAAGMVLIGVTFLPVAWRARAALLLVVAAVLCWMRSGAGELFWPLLGSMFMFRLIVYLHAIRREHEPASWVQAAAYFFLLPNAFFPLFPVVDYRTFRRSYFDGDRPRIYQSGVHWMALGVSHLLLYRLIKTELLPSPLEVQSLPEILQFLAANYALYLRVSGHFHLICGTLHLFGFHLPRTHDWYFLASSFSDVWRRINIYWKDFMLKIFFLPAFFRLRRLGTVPAVSLAVVWVFVWTWLAHSWQVFWLLGEFPMRRADALLWVGVGPVVAISALFDYRRATANRKATDGFQFVPAAVRSLKVIAVFACVSLFWARWTNRQVFQYLLSMIGRNTGSRDVLIVAAAIVIAVMVGVAGQFVAFRIRNVTLLAMSGSTKGRPAGEVSALERSAALHLLPIILILLVAQPPVYQQFGRSAAGMISRLQTERPATGDVLAAVNSYYEELNEPGLQASPLLSSQAPDPARRMAATEYDAITRPIDLPFEVELIPGVRGTLDGRTISINQWGMRDRPTITLRKPPGTIRIALVGSSVVMGYGVADEEVFGRLLEARLNNRGPNGTGHYEVLNFGVGKYYAIHRRALLDRKVLAFQPDAIFYFAHQEEPYYPARQLAALAAQGVSLPDACLLEILDRAGVTDEMAWGQIDGKLRGRDGEILECLYQSFTRRCREQNILPVWIYLPIPAVPDSPPDPAEMLRKVARDAGFVVLDLSHWADGHEVTQLKHKPDDQHPNAAGHRVISDALYQLLEQQPEALPTAD